MGRLNKGVRTAAGVLLVACAAMVPFAVSAKNASVPGKSKSATVDGVVGGEVKCSKWTVIVPPGAYRGTATITIVESGDKSTTVDLSILPESQNHFLVPVTLLYKKTDVSESVADESIYWWNPDKLAWEPAPNLSVDAKNGTLSSGLAHFSTYSIFGTRAGW